jgi:tetratricopeptide (TPR) repeat protein
MPVPESPSRPPAAKRLKVGIVVGLVLVGLAAALVLRLVRDDPQQLLTQAQVAFAPDPQSADGLLRRAIAVSGGRFPDAERLLCLLKARQGDWTEAMQLYGQFDPSEQPAEFLLEFGKVAQRGPHAETARAALEEAGRRQGAVGLAALEVLHEWHRAANDQSRIIETLQELARREPLRIERWLRLLQFLESRRLMSDVAAALREALAQELPLVDQVRLRHRLVALLIEQGDAPSAREELAHLSAAESKFPQSSRHEIKLHEAALCRLEGNPQEALRALEEAQALSSEIPAPEIPGLISLRSSIYFDLQRYSEAAQDLRSMVQSDPFDLVAHFKLAEAYRRLGESDLARQHDEIALDIRAKRQRINRLREDLRRRPKSDLPAMYEELIELHRALNDTAGAQFWERRLQQQAGAPEE